MYAQRSRRWAREMSASLSLSVCLSGLNRNVLIIDLGSGEEFDVRPVFPKQKFDSSEQIERGREGLGLGGYFLGEGSELFFGLILVQPISLTLHCWASRHSQGFEDNNLGSSPALLGQ